MEKRDNANIFRFSFANPKIIPIFAMSKPLSGTKPQIRSGIFCAHTYRIVIKGNYNPNCAVSGRGNTLGVCLKDLDNT